MRTRPRRLAAGFVAAMLALAGCSIIVPSSVPAYHCLPGDPAACPASLVCDPTTLRCVGAGADGDAGDVDVTEDPADAGDDLPVDGALRPSPLGGKCVVDGDCEDGLLCGTSTLLTTAIVPVNSQPICTKPCCSTTECAPGFVCFSAATGGNFCVAADRAERTPPPAGGKSAGGSCTKATDCRSGLCAGRCQDAPGTACNTAEDCPSGACSGSRRCVDTCCASSDCTGGSTCRILTVATHVVWSCGAPNSGSAVKDLGETCSATSECKNDNCVGFPEPAKKCTPPCCTSKDCAALGFADHVCAYGESGNDRIKWCFAVPSGDGGATSAALGAACNANFDCASRYCDAELRKCLNVCCTDEDCGDDEACRPSPVGTPLLRCVKDR